MREHVASMRKELAKIARAAEGVVDELAPQEFAKLLARGCEEAKASDVVALDVTPLSDVANLFIVASGRSDRQTQGIATRAIEAAESRGVKPIAVEGFDRGHWILVDFGDVVLHVFYEPMREHYNIENLWARAKRVELGARRAPGKRSRASLHAA